MCIERTDGECDMLQLAAAGWLGQITRLSVRRPLRKGQYLQKEKEKTTWALLLAIIYREAKYNTGLPRSVTPQDIAGFVPADICWQMNVPKDSTAEHSSSALAVT